MDENRVPRKEIAKKFNTSVSCIAYWLGDSRERRIAYEKNRIRNLPLKERKARYQRQKEYQAEYFKNRYWTDPEFRESVKERNRKYKRENYVYKKK